MDEIHCCKTTAPFFRYILENYKHYRFCFYPISSVQDVVRCKIEKLCIFKEREEIRVVLIENCILKSEQECCRNR